MSDLSSRPYPTAYRPCVGLLVLNRAGHIWIGERIEARNDAEGLGTWWQMPQGGIDEGEEPAAAAMRELHEETGITSARIISETKVWLSYDFPAAFATRAWGGRYRGQKQKWFALRFHGHDDEIDISSPHQPVEFGRWRWSPKDELIDNVVGFKRNIYRNVLAEFDPLIVPE
ncbi:MAG: RNA pyrophosphohydrolase [Alphaproteobacteria bacterium]|nr:RNA pyrophosphohydrolase [Alphaproteobacteria bacterium]